MDAGSAPGGGGGGGGELCWSTQWSTHSAASNIGHIHVGSNVACPESCIVPSCSNIHDLAIYTSAIHAKTHMMIALICLETIV